MTDSLFSSHTPAHAVDVDQSNFMQKVVEASTTTPVIVEFFSPTSSSAQHVSPQLTKAIQAMEGRITLARVNVTTNRTLITQLAQMGLPLQTVPLLVAFWQGQVRDILPGKASESQLKTCLEALLKESGQSLPASALLDAAKTALHSGEWAEATNHYASLLEIEPDSPEGWAGLIRCMIGLNDPEGAEEAASQVPEHLLTAPLITEAKAALQTYLEGQKAAGKLSHLRQAVAQSPEDTTLLTELATALNGAGQRDDAAQLLLDIIARDKDGAGQDAKAQLLKLFESWGMTDPATLAARRKLSSLLFS